MNILTSEHESTHELFIFNTFCFLIPLVQNDTPVLFFLIPSGIQKAYL